MRSSGGQALAEAPWLVSALGPGDAGGMTARTLVRLEDVSLAAGEAEVVVAGPHLPAGLAVLVPLRPAARVGLRASRLSQATATVHGVTLGVVDAALGTDPAVLRMTVSGPSEPWRA